MQVIERNGAERPPEIYDPNKMEALMRKPDVKEIRVFRLRKGMRINVNGSMYKVIVERPNGKVTLKPFE